MAFAAALGCSRLALAGMTELAIHVAALCAGWEGAGPTSVFWRRWQQRCATQPRGRARSVCSHHP